MMALGLSSIPEVAEAGFRHDADHSPRIVQASNVIVAFNHPGARVTFARSMGSASLGTIDFPAYTPLCVIATTALALKEYLDRAIESGSACDEGDPPVDAPVQVEYRPALADLYVTAELESCGCPKPCVFDEGHQASCASVSP